MNDRVYMTPKAAAYADRSEPPEDGAQIVECPVCKGGGESGPDGAPCGACDGEGSLTAKDAWEIRELLAGDVSPEHWEAYERWVEELGKDDAR